MRVPIVLAAALRQRKALQQSIRYVSELFEGIDGKPPRTVSGLASLANSIVVDKESLDALNDKIEAIKIALAQNEKGITEEVDEKLS